MQSGFIIATAVLKDGDGLAPHKRVVIAVGGWLQCNLGPSFVDDFQCATGGHCLWMTSSVQLGAIVCGWLPVCKSRSGLVPSPREEGDLGPVYGFQWRHFGAQYKDMHTDYTGVRVRMGVGVRMGAGVGVCMDAGVRVRMGVGVGVRGTISTSGGFHCCIGSFRRRANSKESLSKGEPSQSKVWSEAVLKQNALGRQPVPIDLSALSPIALASG
eukprot:scaffold49246_cov23-Tisochrysis_lutea.AAC.3